MDQVRYPPPAKGAAAAGDPSVPPLCSWPVVLCGDFNTQLHCQSDSVYRSVVARAFRSVYATTHAGMEPGVTHRTHRGDCTPVDFVFVKSGSPTPEEKKKMKSMLRGEAAASAADAAALAAAASSTGTSAGTFAPRVYPSLRPVYATLLPTSLPATHWPTDGDFNLSDHRPLLALFEICV